MTGLRVEGLTVKFGGLTAVNNVALEAPEGRLTGLIGPNGAGKTTTFNCCTGLVAPTSGSVHLFDDDVTRATPQRRAQMGLGRTFQRMELFDSLTVRENVRLGREAQLAGSKVRTQLFSRTAEQREIEARAEEAMSRCGLQGLATRSAGELSTGQRRLVELARTLCGDFRLLLLDEPSSGLGRDETERFGAILRDVIASRGSGVLLVEHDMSLVLTVCDYIYVLDFGQLIFEGTPDEVRSSDVVRAAYLGSEAA